METENLENQVVESQAEPVVAELQTEPATESTDNVSVSEPAVKEAKIATSTAKSINPVTIKTSVDKVAVLALSRRMLKSRVLIMALPGLFLVALGGLLWGIMASLFIDGALAVGLSMVLAGVLIPVFVYALSYFVLLKRMSERATHGRTKTLNFTIDNENIKVEQTTKTDDSDTEKQEKSVFEWQQIKKVLETNAYVFLIISANLAIILDKNGITDGRIADLMHTLSVKLKKD